MCAAQILIYIICLSIFIALLIIESLFSKKVEPFDWVKEYERLAENYLGSIIPMVICEYCGIKYEKGENYCHLCGTGLKEHII